MPDVEIGREVRGGDRVLSIRVPEEMAAALSGRAKAEDRTLNSLVRALLRQALGGKG